ncbi:MAG: serine/threonine protein kinase [Planctomycetota bacterium]|nr:MAG: serine/threonine protein kinase [Planctomycetota bacterium]
MDSLFQASALASGLVTEEQLDYARRICQHRLKQQGKPAGESLPDRMLAEALVEQEVLTPYQADQLMAGRTKFYLGPYLITDWIGQGGMGRVFKGVHQVMGRECAVKVLPLDRATNEAREAFLREIQMQARLDCPYLVRAFDAGQEGSVHYLVTEYVPGMDLRRLVKSRGPLPIQQAAKIIMQAALGLDYAHREGLVHRDVKPGNILVTPEGDAKVSDVGLAGFAHDLINDPRAGKIVGTTDYLSPEQIRTPLEIQPASDIYSLGCTLYYAVCGKVPFPGGDTESKIRRHLEEYPLHPRTFVPDITEEFVDVIVDMMEKDVRKRIASAAEVAARLEPWVNESLPVGTVLSARSPWMAPPLPGYDGVPAAGEGGEDPSSWDADNPSLGEPSSSTTDAGCTGDTLSEFGSGEKNRVPQEDSQANHALGPPAPLPPHRKPTAWIVAITVALILPPALLIGAIVGYLVSRAM